MHSASIAIFDSGFGGLTVMNAIHALLPHEDILYFGDTAHLPYGNKTPEAILKYTTQSIQYLAKNHSIKLLVIACHSACTAALPFLQQRFSFPILGVTEPGISELLSYKQEGFLAVLGTKATISSNLYQHSLLSLDPLCNILAIPCPLFVPVVETGYLTKNPDLTRAVVKDHLLPLIHKKIDAVLLACTHYPLLQSYLQEEVGPDVFLVNPAQACARNVHRFLQEHNLQNERSHLPRYTFFVSDDPKSFCTLGPIFSSLPFDAVFHVDPQGENKFDPLPPVNSILPFRLKTTEYTDFNRHASDVAF